MTIIDFIIFLIVIITHQFSDPFLKFFITIFLFRKFSDVLH